jgi:hypothetical protein
LLCFLANFFSVSFSSVVGLYFCMFIPFTSKLIFFFFTIVSNYLILIFHLFFSFLHVLTCFHSSFFILFYTLHHSLTFFVSNLLWSVELRLGLPSMFISTLHFIFLFLCLSSFLSSFWFSLSVFCNFIMLFV